MANNVLIIFELVVCFALELMMFLVTYFSITNEVYFQSVLKNGSIWNLTDYCQPALPAYALTGCPDHSEQGSGAVPADQHVP